MFGELSPPTSLTAAVTSPIAEASFMRTMFRAHEMCLPLLVLMVAIFSWPALVLEPGLPQLLPAVMILIVTVGLNASLHGRFSDSLLVQRASQVTASALALALLFRPPLIAAVGLALAIVALIVFGWYRTREHAGATAPAA